MFTLVQHQSDHHPLLLSANNPLVRQAVPFKFFKIWTSHADCRNLVVETWAKNVRGQGMVRWQSKLKNLKQIFKVWNCTVSGDVDKQVRLAVDEVNRIQQLIDTSGFTDQLYAQFLEAQLLLTKALNYLNHLWKEKAKNQNFVHGDRNTSYFHRVSKIRAATKNISLLQNDDIDITDTDEIEVHVLDFFQAIFSVDNSFSQNDLVVQTIPSLVSDIDNQMFLRLPLRAEIKDAVLREKHRVRVIKGGFFHIC